LIDGDNGVIAGHCRVEAAKQLGLDEVPCIVLDNLSEAQKRAYVIADNKLALNAGWDIGTLQAEFEALKEVDFNLELTGFSLEELVDIFPEEESLALCDEDECPGVPDEPTTKLGDVWLLGEHRLMCGDSTSIDAVYKLMDGVTAAMVFTDIPYNISQKSGGLRDLDYGEWDKGVHDIGLQCLTNGYGTSVYMFCDGEQLSGLLSHMKALDMSTRTFIWKKPNPTVMNGQHIWLPSQELCAFGKSKGALFNEKCAHAFWEGVAPVKRVHPNQKPVELIERCVSASSAIGGAVLDYFGGSGSTLIACEKLKRKCYMMELSEFYCDVIIKRYEQYSGKKAELESNDAS